MGHSKSAGAPRNPRKHDIKQKRDERFSIIINAPGVKNKPPKDVNVIHSALPFEDLACELATDVLEHVIAFIIDQGFDEDLQRGKKKTQIFPGA